MYINEQSINILEVWITEKNIELINEKLNKNLLYFSSQDRIKIWALLDNKKNVNIPFTGTIEKAS